MSRRVLLVTLFCNWLLASCGGGGGTTPTVPTNSNVSGVAAVGAALIGASIEVKCIRGTGLATTASDGSFSIDIASAEFPCMVKVSGGTKAGGGANAEVMYSVANAPGRVNVTPLTQLIVSKALSKSAASAYGSFGSVSADISAISAANLTAAQVSLSTEISKIGINANLGSINLFTTAFVPGPTDYVDQYISLVYESLAQNSKSLATASQELTTSTGLQISGTPKAVCRPGVKAGFTAPSGTDAKQAFVPIDVSLSSESGGSPGGSAGGGDGSAGDGSLGQFFSTTVTVEKADGSILGTAKTGESSGGFTMVTCGYAGPLRITMSGTPGSKYFDEGLNQTVSFEGETMRLVIESATKNVGVTPFTDAAHRFLTTKLNTQGLSTSSAWNDPVKIAQANATILATVNRLLPKELFLTDITRMPIVVGPNSVAGSVPDTANGIYGLAIAAFVTQTKNFNPTLARPGIESLKQLADDLGDGVLDRISSSGQGVSSASQAAYSAEALGPSVSASAGQLSKALGVPSLANRRYIVTRTQWRGIGTSYFGLLPRLLNGPPYSYMDLMSDGSIRVLHPDTNAVLADSLDESKSPFLDPKVGSKTKIVKLVGSMALDSNGQLFMAGTAGPGQGNGIVDVDQPLFHTVNSVLGGASISTMAATDNTAYVRTSDGRIWGWGENGFGQMGAFNAVSSVPVSLFPTITDFISVSGAAESIFAVKADGTVWSWGNNTIDAAIGRYGRLGRGKAVLAQTNQLGQVVGLSNVITVVPSAKAIFALTGAGEVYAWGNSFCGVLGDSVPITETHSGNAQKLGLTGVVAINTSGATGYALKSDGTLVYWGSLPANVVEPGENWTDRFPAVCQRSPTPVVFPVGDPRHPGFTTSTKFVKLEKNGQGAVVTTASGQIAVVYGSNAAP